jgi:hypothetical protein
VPSGFDRKAIEWVAPFFNIVLLMNGSRPSPGRGVK